MSLPGAAINKFIEIDVIMKNLVVLCSWNIGSFEFYGILEAVLFHSLSSLGHLNRKCSGIFLIIAVYLPVGLVFLDFAEVFV